MGLHKIGARLLGKLTICIDNILTFKFFIKAFLDLLVNLESVNAPEIRT